MPLLLLLPLLLIAIIGLWLLLLPLMLRQRYRHGSARRRALGWVARVNAWLLAVSVLVLLATAWLGSLWIEDALRDAALGLIAGIAVGIVGLALTRFDAVDGALYYTPNRWLILGLTLLVIARVVLGIWLAWHRAAGAGETPAAWQAWVEAGGLWAIGGLLLGYAATYAWGLSMRIARAQQAA